MNRPSLRRARPALTVLEGRDAPAVLTVTNANDSGDGSLRAEIALADPGDTIQFAADVRGTIALTSGELPIRYGIDIQGPGSDLLTVSGNNSSRVFNVSDLITVTISGLTISGGRSNGAGGGILNAGTLTLDQCVVANNSAGFSDGGGVANTGSLTVTGCTVTGNAASNGGGVANTLNNGTGSLTLTGDTISGNTATGSGGGVYSSLFGFGAGAASVQMTDSSLTGNTAASTGGGFYALTSTLNETFQATVELTRCNVSGNASGSAAGVYTYASGQVQQLFTDCTVADNTAGGSAGGIETFTSTSGNTRAYVILTGCTVSGNRANSGGTGGGVYVSAGGFGTSVTAVTLTNCTLAGNSADFAGGGLWSSLSGTATLGLTNCTVAGNASTGFLGTGGGLSAGSANVRLLNTIVAGNSAAFASRDVYGLVSSQGYNLIGRTDGSSGWVDSDLTGTDANPLDARLGTLRDNGGPTQTIALLADSPAVAGGTSMGAPATDQRGATRSDPPSIGAVEYVATVVDHFRVTAPTTVAAGDAFAVTVVAEDQYGNPVTNYAGTVYLGSTDPQAPDFGSWTFTAADQGGFTFASVSLLTTGTQTLYAYTDVLGGSTDVLVTAT